MNIYKIPHLEKQFTARLNSAHLAHHGHVVNFGPGSLPGTLPNAKLFSLESNISRLLGASPINLIKNDKIDSSYFIRKLFDDDKSLVCMGMTIKEMTTNYLCTYNLSNYSPSYIVPAYMTDFVGLTVGYPDGDGEKKISPRCNANTGDARYVVYNCEQFGLEDQAERIIRLALEAPLVLVVLTAKGHLNAWYSVIGWEKNDVKCLRHRARHFGSCFKTSIGCHPYPFPGGKEIYYVKKDRQPKIPVSGIHQAVYFDAAAIGTKVI